MLQQLILCGAVLSPFPFYWYLWRWPQTFVDFCGRAVDPSHRMAQISSVLKAVQMLALLSVSTFRTWPPWWSILLIAVGQFLNIRVYQLLGEEGVYYGVRFGKKIPWVTSFPFGTIKDPQYVGSVLTLLGCLPYSPLFYVLLWILGYAFMCLVESKEDTSTRAKR